MNGFPIDGMDTEELVDGLINAARLAGEVDAVATDADPQTTINCAAADERVDAWRAALLAAIAPAPVSRTLEWNEPETESGPFEVDTAPVESVGGFEV